MHRILEGRSQSSVRWRNSYLDVSFTRIAIYLNNIAASNLIWHEVSYMNIRVLELTFTWSDSGLLINPLLAALLSMLISSAAATIIHWTSTINPITLLITALTVSDASISTKYYWQHQVQCCQVQCHRKGGSQLDLSDSDCFLCSLTTHLPPLPPPAQSLILPRTLQCYYSDYYYNSSHGGIAGWCTRR